MRKAQVVLGLALVALFGSLASAAIPGGGSTSDGNVSLVYDPADGNLRLDAGGKQVSTLEIQSTAGYFTGAKPAQLTGLFDVFNKNKLFRLFPAGMGNEDFGKAMTPGLSADALMADLRVNGSILPSGNLGSPDLVYVPEPSSLALLALGLLGLVRARRS